MARSTPRAPPRRRGRETPLVQRCDVHCGAQTAVRVTTRRQTRELFLGFLRAALIGVAGGLASYAFRAATALTQKAAGLGENILDAARGLPWWQLVLTPTIGAAICALVTIVVVRGSPGAELSDVMEAVSLKSGPVRFRATVYRALASLGIIATGGSVGREGPIIALASAASSGLARLLGAPARDRPLLLGCGVAAGFASAYNAPIAGAIFALEVVLGNFAMEVFAPVVVAAVSSTLFTWTVEHRTNAIYTLPVPAFSLHTVAEVVPYLALGVAAGIVAVGFQRLLTMTEGAFQRLPLPRWGQTLLGGALIGAFAIAVPEVWGNGYESVSEILNGSSPRLAEFDGVSLALGLFVLGVAKAVGTAITVGSGGAGGVFTPTLFVGAGLGGAVGALVHRFAPHSSGTYGGYALVGMGCLCAGTTRAPIMAILVIYEMTRNYEIVMPLMLGCITATLVARTIYPESIYTEKLRARGVTSPVGLEETVLVTTRVTDVMRRDPLTWVDHRATYGEIVPLATAARATVVYVCGAEKRLLGAIRVHDLIELAAMQDLGPGIIADDLRTPVEAVHEEQRLSEAFEFFERSDLDELPVVSKDAVGALIGVVTRKDVMAALHIEVLKRQNLRAKFVHRDDERSATDYVELPKGVELARVPVRAEHVGRTLGECRIRAAHQLTVVSVVRRDESGQELRILADGEFTMRAGDHLIVLGTSDALTRWRTP